MSQSDIDALIAQMTAGGGAAAEPAVPAEPPEPVALEAEPAPAAQVIAELPAEQEAAVIDLGPIAQAEVDAVLQAAGMAYAVMDPTAAVAPAPPPEASGTGMTQADIDAIVASTAPAAAAPPPAPPLPAAASDVLMEVELTLTAELVRTRMKLNDLLSLQLGAVIELNRMATEPVDVTVNGVQLMKASVVTIGENYGVQVIESRLKAS